MGLLPSHWAAALEAEGSLRVLDGEPALAALPYSFHRRDDARALITQMRDAVLRAADFPRPAACPEAGAAVSAPRPFALAALYKPRAWRRIRHARARRGMGLASRRRFGLPVQAGPEYRNPPAGGPYKKQRRFLMRKLCLAAALAAMMSAGLAQAQSTLRIGLQDDPDVLDPVRARTFVGRIVFASLCDKLVDITPDLKIVPQLAQSWTTSDDNKTLTFAAQGRGVP